MLTRIQTRQEQCDKKEPAISHVKTQTEAVKLFIRLQHLSIVILFAFLNLKP